MQVSLFASAVRRKLWPEYLLSLEQTSLRYEVIFAGDVARDIDTGFIFHLIRTGHIKPAQCYEIARRACSGEVIVWTADDCEFKGDIIGRAYKHWKAQGDDRLILSLQTEESGIWQNMNDHRFFGSGDTPLMAPIGMASRAFIDELGGFDRRYICGQYENDLMMRAYAAGGRCEIFGDRVSYVEINHKEKSVLAGEITTKQEFEGRPFATGYANDRFTLEKSWCKLNEVRLLLAIKNNSRTVMQKEYMDMLTPRTDVFEPYAKDISLTKSESNRGIWD